MIRQETYARANALATSLYDRSCVAMPIGNSPLSELYRLSYPFITKKGEGAGVREGTGNTDVGFIGVAVQMASSSDGYTPGRSLHDATADDVGKDLQAILKKHLLFARTVVNPVVVDFTTRLETWLNDNRHYDPTRDFNIVQVALPELLTDTTFVETLKAHESTNPYLPQTNFHHIAIKPDEMLALFQTGSARVDGLIGSWLMACQLDDLSYQWNTFFANGTVGEGSYKDVAGEPNLLNRINKLLMLFLTARKLRNEPQAVEGTNLINYTNEVNQILQFASSHLLRAVTRYELYLKNDTLVLNTDSYAKTMYVHADVYNNWVTSGGNIEVLFGLLSSNQTGIMTVPAIDEKAKEFHREWTSYGTYSRSLHETRRFSSFLTYIEACFIDDLKHLKEEEEARIASNPETKATMMKFLKEELAAIKPEMMVSPGEIALNIIGRCRFYYSSGYFILNEINNAGKMTKDIDVREAALFAAVKYLATYFAKQIAIRRK